MLCVENFICILTHEVRSRNATSCWGSYLQLFPQSPVPLLTKRYRAQLSLTLMFSGYERNHRFRFTASILRMSDSKQDVSAWSNPRSTELSSTFQSRPGFDLIMFWSSFHFNRDIRRLLSSAYSILFEARALFATPILAFHSSIGFFSHRRLGPRPFHRVLLCLIILLLRQCRLCPICTNDTYSAFPKGYLRPPYPWGHLFLWVGH